MCPDGYSYGSMFESTILSEVCGSYVSCVMRKPVIRVSNYVRHKPGFTATEDGQRLEISDLQCRGVVLSK